MRLRLEFSNGVDRSAGQIYMNYKDRQVEKAKARTKQMYKYLLQAQVSMVNNNENEIFRYANIVISKSGTGLNYFQDNSSIDEMELKQLLIRLKK